MTFFSQDFLDFFAELTQHNHKEWFDANKKRYEQSVKKPFEAFVGWLIGEVQQWDPRVQQQPKDAIFRINRDVRFSADKTPYKTNRSAFISQAGRKSTLPGHYIQLGADSLWVGGGLYEPTKEQLAAIRSNLSAEPTALDAPRLHPDFVRCYGEIKGARNKVLPADLKAAAATQPLLYHKQWYFMHEDPNPARILAPDFGDWVLQHLRAGHALNMALESLLD